MERASNLRMIALASVAALAVALPLAAATAGPAGQGRKAPATPPGLVGNASRESAGAPEGAASDAAKTGNAAGKSADNGLKESPSGAAKNAGGLLGDSGLDLPPIPGAPGTAGSIGVSGAQSNTGGQSSASANCGPQLTSPHGVEAQTCVLTDGHNTWGRTYYRNTTGSPLTAVLTLMRPDQRTVVVHCAVAASAEPRVCETPHDPTVAPNPSAPPYQAVAEFASADGDRVLLHAGSDGGGDTDQ
ncbi:hypothetical protein [Streptantibioticus ferralitis]|uniref:Uncharacterized protein n=1 Tax=Streptantibioticus ferralitis TaxID=236510 RepID=A0ABT5Z0K9_9ACTN|nr:hypothetical protein [Streptantibioticus ferralitis]MDF2257380.1 hypothetical protein [Streptantibioticus ferralitis]